MGGAIHGNALQLASKVSTSISHFTQRKKLYNLRYLPDFFYPGGVPPPGPPWLRPLAAGGTSSPRTPLAVHSAGFLVHSKMMPGGLGALWELEIAIQIRTLQLSSKLVGF